jgi:hypothetical protein
MWNEIISHDKVEEYLKINGTINGVANYYLVASVGKFKSFAIIQLSVGDKVLTATEGSRAIANLKGSDYSILRYSSSDGITVDIKESGNRAENLYASDPKAFLAIENKMSLVKGNSIFFLYKEAAPSAHYIKHWEMPTSFASFAAFSDSSSIASVAQKVISAGTFTQGQGNVVVSKVAELLDGTFYVIGADCTDTLKFMCTDHLAIRLIIKEEIRNEADDELNQVMNAIQVQPLVHLKIRLDKFKTPFVVFRRENDMAESAVNLIDTNMVISIPASETEDIEIVRIEHSEHHDGFPVLKLTLNNLRKQFCPYVAVWKY